MVQVKVFVDNSLARALAKAREELGADALIVGRERIEDESGRKLWCIHAAREVEGGQQESMEQPPAIHHALIRLERLIGSLEGQRQASFRDKLASPAHRHAYDCLLQDGMHPGIAVELASHVEENSLREAKILRWGKRIQVGKTCQSIAFVGPTGSGKSTLIGKLATWFVRHRGSVALVSTDTEKLGGGALLRQVAKALQLPFHEVRELSDAEDFFRKQRNSVDLILIDSHGQVAEQRYPAPFGRVLSIFNCTRCFLVLPINIDEVDALRFFEKVRGYSLTDLAVTKLDEGTMPGKVVNFSVNLQLPFSYSSSSPGISEGIGWVSPDSLNALLTVSWAKQTYGRKAHASC